MVYYDAHNDSTETTDCWYAWNYTDTTASSSSTNCYTITWNSWVTTHEETKLERKKRERRERREIRERLRRQREADKSEEKAKQLLMDLIGPDELKRYEASGRLFVKGKKYDYVIQRYGHVKRIGKDKVTDLCVHLENRTKYPDTDNVIAMKLLIEHDEALVNRLANDHGSIPADDYNIPEAACI